MLSGLMLLLMLGMYPRLAQFTSAFVRLVGQEPAPSKCIFMSTSAVVRKDISDGGERWSVKLDVRNLGGHLDTLCRAWGCTHCC